MFSLNLNFQISSSCLIPWASQLFHPHRLVSSNLFSLSLSLSRCGSTQLYLHPRQSIKVLNGGVYLVMNIQHDDEQRIEKIKINPFQVKLFCVCFWWYKSSKINFTNLKYIHYLCVQTFCLFFFFFFTTHITMFLKIYVQNKCFCQVTRWALSW